MPRPTPHDLEALASRVLRSAIDWCSYQDANGLIDPSDRVSRAAANFARLRLMLDCARYAAATHVDATREVHSA